MTDKPEIRLGDFVDRIDQEIPFALAEAWDKVGLLIGDPDTLISGAVVALDVTENTIQLAESNNCNLIIAHHPLIFSPIGTLREDIAEQALIRLLIHKDMAVIALHTNLDAVRGGTADRLADALELAEKSRTVFLPCNNPTALSGRFTAGEGTDNEISERPGHGRMIDLEAPIDSRHLKNILTQRLGSSGVRLNTDRIGQIRRFAVFPGSFDESWIDRLLDFDIEAIVTGELKHHVGLKLSLRGILAFDTGHDVSERVVLPHLAHQLKLLEPEMTFAVDYGFDYNKVTF